MTVLQRTVLLSHRLNNLKVLYLSRNMEVLFLGSVAKCNSEVAVKSVLLHLPARTTVWYIAWWMRVSLDGKVFLPEKGGSCCLCFAGREGGRSA